MILTCLFETPVLPFLDVEGRVWFRAWAEGGGRLGSVGLVIVTEAGIYGWMWMDVVLGR